MRVQLHHEDAGAEVTAKRLSRAEPDAWIEGLLEDGADILLHNMSLLAVVYRLAMLRRSLSAFDSHQRGAVREAVARMQDR